MKEILNQLSAATGFYTGEGINHEGQPFLGSLSLLPILDGRGFSLKFTATGKDGTVYHKEESTIAPSMSEAMTLWNFNSNTPGLLAHELRKTPAKAKAKASYVFGFNKPEEINAFREEVAVDIWENGELSYTYSWGMPGGEFKERSGVRMTRNAVNHNKVEFLSAALLISKDASRLATFYRDVIGLPLEDEKHGDTELHYGCELGDLHFAIHPIENFKDSEYGVGSVKLAFTVFNMTEFVTRIESKGYKLAYPPKDTGFAKMTAITDPDGNYVEFTELSDRWFEHLSKRRNQGHDVIQRWNESKR